VQYARHSSTGHRQPDGLRQSHGLVPEHWRFIGRGEAFRANIVFFADDFVILGRGSAEEALAWTKAVMTRAGLMLNEEKIPSRDARSESFDFLGYAFGPEGYRKDSNWYLGVSPSKKSVQRIKIKVTESLRPGEQASWPQVRESGYFDYCTRLPAYWSVGYHIQDCARHFLARRHKVQGRTRWFPQSDVFRELDMPHLRRVRLGPPPRALPWSQPESRMRKIRISCLMSEGGKRGVAAWPKQPRPSSTLQSAAVIECCI
jgi:RNA-directed DNA polymerase